LTRTRILLIDMPRVLREIIRTTLERDPALEIVGELTEQVSVVRALDGVEADFVIAGSDALHSEDVGGRLLEQDARVRVLAVRADGGQTVVCEPLGDLSPEALLAVVKGGA
jgi:hypothetical protein